MNMKKRNLLFVVVICATAGIGYYQANKVNREAISSLALENINALAEGEGQNIRCYWYGDLDCHGKKVKRIITGFSFD